MHIHKIIYTIHTYKLTCTHIFTQTLPRANIEFATRQLQHQLAKNNLLHLGAAKRSKIRRCSG